MRGGANTYAEVTVSRRGEKGGPINQLCGSLCCSLIGIGTFFGALALIASNEKSTVCVSKALDAAVSSHDPIGCDGQARGGGGKPVHFSCAVDKASLPTWTPSHFGAQWLEGAFSTSAVKVRQEVEMLQCKEKTHTREERRGDKVTKIKSWTYDRVWSSRAIPSSSFKAWSNSGAREALENGCGYDFSGNPSFPMSSQVLAAPSLVAGAYELSRHLKSIATDSPVMLQVGSYNPPFSTGSGGHRDDGSTDSRPRRIARDGQAYTRQEFIDYYGEERGLDMWDDARKAPSSTPRKRVSSGEALVQGNVVSTCSRDEFGCLRISYTQASLRDLSALTALSSDGRRTKPWAAPSAWMCSGGSASNQVDLFSPGGLSAAELADKAQAANTAQMWLFRLVGIALSILGVWAFLQPIQTLADLVDQFFDWFRFIPVIGWALDFLGDVVAGAVGCAISAISVGFGMSCSLAILSATWAIMRPLLGIPMLAACVALFGWTVKSMCEYAKIGQHKRKKA